MVHVLVYVSSTMFIEATVCVCMYVYAHVCKNNKLRLFTSLLKQSPDSEHILKLELLNVRCG